VLFGIAISVASNLLRLYPF